MKKKILLLAVLLASTQLLAACGTSCDCPKCGGTTVVTPEHTTVVRPSNND
jgi:hypothetical protein